MIDCYDLTKGWLRVPSPIGETAGNPEELRVMGCEEFARLGDSARTQYSLEIWALPDDRFLFFVNSAERWRPLLAQNLISAIELMQKLAALRIAESLEDIEGKLKAVLERLSGSTT